MSRSIAILVLLLMFQAGFINSLFARGGVLQTSFVDEAFETEALAVIDASNRHNPDSIKRNREHVGGVLQCEGGYYYTHAVGKRAQAPIQFAVKIAKGCSLVAFWHTHGGRSEHREYFSPSDTNTANTTGKRFYMADYRGNLSVYAPGDEVFTKKKIRVSDVPPGAALGRPVKLGGEILLVAH